MGSSNTTVKPVARRRSAGMYSNSGFGGNNFGSFGSGGFDQFGGFDASGFPPGTDLSQFNAQYGALGTQGLLKQSLF